MIVVVFLVALILGAILGAATLYKALPKRLKQHVDYKERWLLSVKLLGEQGKLTDDQVAALTAGAAATKPAKRAIVSPEQATQRMLHGMYSDDRRKAEIARAKAGQEPLDDLHGMYSDDIAAVLKARAKYSTGDKTP